MRTINAFSPVFSLSLCLLIAGAGTMGAVHAQAQAQTTTAKPAAAAAKASANASSTPGLATQITSPIVQGKTNDGKAFKLSSLKGKVTLVMFWSTECAICRDKMPELRENYKGWAGKPFELVLISVDRRMKDVDDYEAIVSRMVPLQQRFVQLWAGDPSYQDNLGSAQLQRTQLPAAFLVDKKGKIVERYNGRIPAEVWDTIADLL